MNPTDTVVQFEIGNMQNFVYLILDRAQKTAAIVDPQKDLDEPLAFLKKEGMSLSQIILTHTHFDHTAGVGPLLKLFPKIEIRVGARDLHRLSKSILDAPGLKVIEHEGTFSVGKIEIHTLLTPGHSAGAISYFLPVSAQNAKPQVFTGDTIFIRDCGRTDLETGSNAEMFDSIQKIKKLPPETILWVGHHYAKESVTHLEVEMKESPPFRVKSVDELAALP